MDTEWVPAFTMKDIAQTCRDHLFYFDRPYADVFPIVTEYPIKDMVTIFARPDAPVYCPLVRFQAERILHETDADGVRVRSSIQPARFMYTVGDDSMPPFVLPIDSLQHLRCILQALYRIRTDAEYDAHATREYFDMSPEQRVWWANDYGDTTHMPNPYRNPEAPLVPPLEDMDGSWTVFK